MLGEIQRTGDIFFPLDWTNAVLGGHNSPAAAQTVTAFLAARKDYPPRLRRVIVDKGVSIPAGFVAGEDPESDRARFVVSDGGVVVIPRFTELE